MVVVDRLGAGVVAGGGEVPVDLDFGGAEVEGSAALGFAEEAGIGGDFEGGGRIVVEIDGETVGGGGLTPCDGDRHLLPGGEGGSVQRGDAVLDGGGGGIGGNAGVISVI